MDYSIRSKYIKPFISFQNVPEISFFLKTFKELMGLVQHLLHYHNTTRHRNKILPLKHKKISDIVKIQLILAASDKVKDILRYVHWIISLGI